MKKPYLPTIESQRVIWLNNFASKIDDYATTFGIIDDEVEKIVASATLYNYIIGLIDLAKDFGKELTQFKDVLSIAPNGTTLGAIPVFNGGTVPAVVPAGIFTMISGIVKRIKSSNTNYTEAIGMDLGIIGEETNFDQDSFKSVISGKSMPGSVTITFSKKGIDGVNVYSLPVGSTDPAIWEKLSYDGHSPYHDTRPLATAGTPENRQYKVRGVINDLEIGQWSDIITVTFAG